MTDLVPVSHATHVMRRASSSHSFKPGQYIPVVSGDAPPYQGPYEADALFSEQVFATQAKLMTADFAVHAINYTEAPNDSGVTVTIGG